MTKKRADWPQKLDAAIKRKYGIKTKTYFDLIGSMRYVTRRVDANKPLGREIHRFIQKWMTANVPA